MPSALPHFCDHSPKGRGGRDGKVCVSLWGELQLDICSFLFLLLWFSWSDIAVMVRIPHLLIPRQRPVLPGPLVIFTLIFFKKLLILYWSVAD